MVRQLISHPYTYPIDQRFGPGPYYIEFTLNVNGEKKFFTLETAPNDLMPHSVYYFMDMVERNIWEDTVLMHKHKLNHIVTAALVSPSGENKRDQAVGELSFPEYSDEYRHDEYTVGFVGRPGGPEFYFNLEDNSDMHGPGKQSHSTVMNDADPCFAKVIIGKHVLAGLKEITKGTTEESDLIFTAIEKVQRISVSQKKLESLGLR